MEAVMKKINEGSDFCREMLAVGVNGVNIQRGRDIVGQDCL
jgi:hypothetical protein